VVSEADKQLWEEYTEAWTNFIYKRHLLEKNGENLLLLIKAVLSSRPYINIGAVLHFIDKLSSNELIDLFPLLLQHAADTSGRSNPQEFRKIILALPKVWVLENIEKFAEPILNDNLNDNHPDVYMEYGQMLALYYQIETNLTLRLIDRAIAHPNPDVQEMGHDWQQYITSDMSKSEEKS
jgi:hypothetical protein